jgi:hypothetical protein
MVKDFENRCGFQPGASAVSIEAALPDRRFRLETNSLSGARRSRIDAEYRFAAENGFNPSSLLGTR